MNYNYSQPTYQVSAAGAQPKRWEVNITPAERIGRIIIGIAGIVGGILLLAGAPTLLTGFLEVLLILAGLDMLITGASGHCPLYKKLGYTPKSLQGERHGSRPHATGDGPACH